MHNPKLPVRSCARGTGWLPDEFRAQGRWLDGRWPAKGGHALAILPGLTHYDIFSSPLLAAVTLAFLDDQPS